jgi:hypothetical protein
MHACLSLAGSDRLIWVILMPVSDFAARILVCLQRSAANPTICPERVLRVLRASPHWLACWERRHPEDLLLQSNMIR